MIEYKAGKNLIEFDDRPTARQRYKLNGVKVPGVTTMIKAGLPENFNLINWKIRQASGYVYDVCQEGTIADKESVVKESLTAWQIKSKEEAGIGVVLHEYAHLMGLNKDKEAYEFLENYKEDPNWDKIQNAVYKFDDFNKQNEDEIVHLEQCVGSIKYGFAGRFDRLAKRGKDLILTDYKTSKKFYPEQFIQDGAYSIAIKEWFGLEVTAYEVIRFGKEEGDKEFDSLVINDPKDLLMFQDQALRCLDTYNWMKSINKDKRFK